MSRTQVDTLARLAANAEPPALDDTAARRLVDAAIADAPRTPSALQAAARPSVIASVGRSRTGWWVAAAAIAAAAVLAVIVVRARTPEPALLHVALPTGDALTGTAGARFEIAELTPASRKLRLDAGAMVFDVAHVVAGQRFEVAAGDVTVIATGTVFSVAADPRGAHVHVYEGSVEVRRASRVEKLTAGGEWSAAPGIASDPPALIEAGHAAAQARAVHVASIAAPAPSSAPRVITVPIPFPIVIRVPAPAPAPAPAAASAPVPAAGAEPATATATASVPATATVPATAAAAVADPEPAAAPASADLIAARADITAGRYTNALTKVAAAPHPLTGAWLLVDADGLRALGKKRDAADALATAAPLLDGTAQLEAAYSAAYLRFHDLHDAAGALAVLTAADVDIPGSLFEERGLALHVQILVAGGKRAEARPLAKRYLERLSLGELRPLMLSIVRQDASK